MKRYILLFSALFILSINLIYSQQSTGIKNSQVKGLYLTHDSFKQNEFGCSLAKIQEDGKIKLKQFFISPEISCVNIDDETIFYKDSIFAIQLNNGENFRFIKLTPYYIVDTSFLYIYTYKTIKTEYKKSGPTRRPNEIPVTYYCFSSGNHNDVYPLTVTNLFKFSSVNPNIKEAICQKFINDEMLYSVNQKTSHFVLNEFLIALVKTAQ